MIGQQFTSEDDYTEVAVQGYPIEVVATWDAPVFLQVARRLRGYERVTWDINDVPFPPGDFIFGRCHGLRVKSNGDTPANVFIIQRFKEDPVIVSFDPT